MSEGDDKNSNSPYAYTRGEYWGGAQVPFWMYMILTVFPFTGFLGIDHLLFRSPTSAVQKALVNFVSLGYWYFYDMIQIFSDKDYVAKYGLARPFFGPTGLAHKYFTGLGAPESNKNNANGGNGNAKKNNNANNAGGGSSTAPSPLIFVIYFLTILIPFGISNFIAGDFIGGAYKLVLSIFIPFVILWNIMEWSSLVFDPKYTFEKGIYYLFPATWLIAPRGYAPNIMEPKAASEMSAPGGFLATIAKLFGFGSLLDAVGVAKCEVEPAVAAVGQTASAAASFAGTAATIPGKVSGQLAAFTDPAKLKAMSGQTGGSIVPRDMSLIPTGALDSWFAIALGTLVVGGFTLSAVRHLRNLRSKKDEPTEPESVERDDTPPRSNDV